MKVSASRPLVILALLVAPVLALNSHGQESRSRTNGPSS